MAIKKRDRYLCCYKTEQYYHNNTTISLYKSKKKIRSRLLKIKTKTQNSKTVIQKQGCAVKSTLIALLHFSYKYIPAFRNNWLNKNKNSKVTYLFIKIYGGISI